jgi:hypothetical protein
MLRIVLLDAKLDVVSLGQGKLLQQHSEDLPGNIDELTNCNEIAAYDNSIELEIDRF